MAAARSPRPDRRVEEGGDVVVGGVGPPHLQVPQAANVKMHQGFRINDPCRGRGMVALALGRDADVPTSCAKLRKPLARYAAVVKTMLAK
jgi:hypothetical protein